MQMPLASKYNIYNFMFNIILSGTKYNLIIYLCDCRWHVRMNGRSTKWLYSVM